MIFSSAWNDFYKATIENRVQRNKNVLLYSVAPKLIVWINEILIYSLQLKMNWIFMYDCEYIIRTCNIQVANVHLSSYPAINSRNPGTLQIFSKTWWNIRIKIAMYIKYDVTVCGRNRRMWSEKLNTGEHSSIKNLYGLKYMSNRNVNQFSSATTFVFFDRRSINNSRSR